VLEKALQPESTKGRSEEYVRENSALEARIRLLDRPVEFFGPNGGMTGQASSRMPATSRFSRGPGIEIRPRWLENRLGIAFARRKTAAFDVKPKRR